MAGALLRGLDLLEAVDTHGPLILADLTRLLGWDKASVSRTVTALVTEGWLTRDDAAIGLGPRAALLGREHASTLAATDAAELVHSVSGVLGLPAHAYVLSGASVAAVATSAAPGRAAPAMTSIRMPLWVSAGAKVVAAQLDVSTLDRLLPDDPLPLPDIERIASPDDVAAFYASLPHALPDPGPSTLVTTRPALDEQLDRIRREGSFTEQRELGRGLACVAVPWLRPGVHAALSVIGPVADVERRAALIDRVLRSAAEAGADRESVVRAAAAQ